jgi:type IV secretion system pilin
MAAAVVVASTSFAAAAAPAVAAGPMVAVKTLPEVIDSATVWLIGILAAAGVFFFTLGGARYMFAGGDPAEIQKAKLAFRGAALGFALAVLAPVLMNVLKSILGA